MSIEENKKIAANFFENMSSGNAAAVMNALADNATWWVAGNFALSAPRPSSNSLS